MKGLGEAIEAKQERESLQLRRLEGLTDVVCALVI